MRWYHLLFALYCTPSLNLYEVPIHLECIYKPCVSFFINFSFSSNCSLLLSCSSTSSLSTLLTISSIHVRLMRYIHYIIVLFTFCMCDAHTFHQLLHFIIYLSPSIRATFVHSIDFFPVWGLLRLTLIIILVIICKD